LFLRGGAFGRGRIRSTGNFLLVKSHKLDLRVVTGSVCSDLGWSKIGANSVRA